MSRASPPCAGCATPRRPMLCRSVQASVPGIPADLGRVHSVQSVQSTSMNQDNDGSRRVVCPWGYGNGLNGLNALNTAFFLGTSPIRPERRPVQALNGRHRTGTSAAPSRPPYGRRSWPLRRGRRRGRALAQSASAPPWKPAQTRTGSHPDCNERCNGLRPFVHFAAFGPFQTRPARRMSWPARAAGVRLVVRCSRRAARPVRRGDA